MRLARPRRRPTVSVNAMSDIAFLLLIFIMLISLINYRQEEPIEYPEAQQTEVTQADRNFEVWVRVDGTIAINGEAVTPATAEGLIAEAIAEDPSVRIHLLADRATEYRNVAGIVEILQTLQHRVVSLVVADRSGTGRSGTGRSGTGRSGSSQ